uniref:Putative secreted protein n=1 Tax=Anopheles darlingi TaxID=43151 RepID=A0A2M4DBL6_ANODA
MRSDTEGVRCLCGALLLSSACLCVPLVPSRVALQTLSVPSRARLFMEAVYVMHQPLHSAGRPDCIVLSREESTKPRNVLVCLFTFASSLSPLHSIRNDDELGRDG